MAHVIITGPGRSGTTFLLQLLRQLGYDTGFKPDDDFYEEKYRAGFEYIVEDFNWDNPTPEQFEGLPHILKGPEWSFYLKPFIKAGYLEVDHVILPIRDLDISVKSRLDVGLFWRIDLGYPVESQTEVMAAALGRVVEACVLFELPCTVMRFPDLVTSEKYCCQKLSKAFDIPRAEFGEIFNELSRPEQIKWHA